MKKTGLIAITIYLTTYAGIVNAQEAPPSAPEAMTAASTALAAMDLDKNGDVSMSEWLAAGRREQGFTRVDTNADGKIVLSEISAAMAALQRRAN